MIVSANAPGAIDAAAARIAAGGLVAFATETVYGLGADACNATAVAAVFAAKGRPADHPLIVHMHAASEVAHFASSVPDFAQKLIEAFWPGPLTLILPRKSGVAGASAGGQDSIGLRCPDHPDALTLLRACSALGIHGIAAPSANRFGKISPTTAAHVQAAFAAVLPDDLMILDGGPCSVGIESAIVDCTRGAPVLLRPGMLGAAQIEAAMGQPLAQQALLKVEQTNQQMHRRTADLVNNNTAQSNVGTGAAEGRAGGALSQPAPKASGTLEAHYAPNARLRLMDAKALQTALDVLGAEAAHIAVYSRSVLASRSARILRRRMPDDAAATAQQLFAVLRAFDAEQVKLIWVETLPADAAWDGVRDRLLRAAASH